MLALFAQLPCGDRVDVTLVGPKPNPSTAHFSAAWHHNFALYSQTTARNWLGRELEPRQTLGCYS